MIKAEVVFSMNLIIVNGYQIDVGEDCCGLWCKVYRTGEEMGSDNALLSTDVLEEAIKYCLEN